jgi:hypothetical protein
MVKRVSLCAVLAVFGLVFMTGNGRSQNLGAILSAGDRVAQGPPGGDPYLLKIGKNGDVLNTAILKAVFWGPEWMDEDFAEDRISGIDTLFSGYSGSDYAGILEEYSDRSGPITGNTIYQGHVYDTSTAPAAGGLTGSVAVAKVCELTQNNPDPNGVYFIFTSTPKAPGSSGLACVVYSFGSCSNRKPVQVVGVPYTTGEIGSGCQGVQDTVTGHSLGLAQMANLAMYGLAETITDPRNTGWHDSNGDKIANKCILVFPADPSSYTVFSDLTVWKLQGLWSNRAYLSGAGAPNGDGQKGCVWR